MNNSKRVQNEKNAYDMGSVLQNNARLQARFEHVFFCPNSNYGEAFYAEMIKTSSQRGVVLDYGCHNGWLCPTLLKYGPNKIIGIDISEKGIHQAKENFGDVADYYVMDAHRLEFEDNSFDVIVGRAILHHLDYEQAIAEIRRVLKPGGRAIFIEPLRDNPGAKILRLLTHKARTIDELPLSRRQIRFANDLFSSHSHVYFGLFSVVGGMISSLVSCNPCNMGMRLMHRLDLAVSRTTIKYWMRNGVLSWQK